MTDVIKDSNKGHWVNRAAVSIRPYLQLSRLDRPVGYWLLTLPGWIGLAFASLSHGLAASDLKWAALILIGAIAMRGAGCTYNDIVDQDLDKQVERTALRPLPAGTVTSRQAWLWLFAQCFIGLCVLLCLPRLAQYISLLSIPLVAAYPFMKRITWFPQVWLGMTFNWAVLVAYAAKTGTVSAQLFILYAGFIFWTVGYDTIYACQDIEDDMKIGVKSTARKFGARVKLAVCICYALALTLICLSSYIEIGHQARTPDIGPDSALGHAHYIVMHPAISFMAILAFVGLFFWQTKTLVPDSSVNALNRFKSNTWIMLLLTIIWLAISLHIETALFISQRFTAS